MSRWIVLILFALLAGLAPGCETRVRDTQAAQTAQQADVPAAVSSNTADANTKVDTAAAPAAPGAELGVEVVALRRSAAGYMLDLRYRITDPKRAAAFLDPHAERYLIDQATGARLRVPSAPKVGALRQAPQVPDPQRVYFTLFANPGRRVQPGDRVTLAIGELRASDLVVE